MTADPAQRRRRVGIAWLAVLALLINALVPASLSVAAGHRQAVGSGWCGAAPGGPEPGNGTAPRICDHCILCAAAANGLEPPNPAVVRLASATALHDLCPRR